MRTVRPRTALREPAEPARSPPQTTAGSQCDTTRRDGLVLVGTSTGGPPALEALLTPLPASFPWPILIAQHMPASFTGPLARRLDGICALRVTEVVQPIALSRASSTSAAATPI